MLIRADARWLPLRNGCVQCVVTSPPFWNLRDYGHTGQIGLESTPDAYVANLVAVFCEVRRVLNDDGTLWLNLGSSYAAAGCCGFKPKDLIPIPWLVAMALQQDGWWLRSDCIWSKPNVMPSSVRDRPTISHEYVFLLAKSERYFYDADAIREPIAQSTIDKGGYDDHGRSNWPENRTAKPSDLRVAEFSGNMKPGRRVSINMAGANKRSVWTVPTLPYAGAHFATFPPKLIEPCILAGSRPGDLVLDPFIGSGTTGAVCERLMRRWVGTDLSYQHLSSARTRQRGLRFVDEEPQVIDEARDRLRRTVAEKPPGFSHTSPCGHPCGPERGRFGASEPSRHRQRCSKQHLPSTAG